MQRICLINVYFGARWPEYFPYFLASCKYNPRITFLFFSNLPITPELPNVKAVYLKDLASFNAIATGKLGFTVKLVEAFKLCDLKPAYGKIFEDYLNEFDFWGYCDIDIILGRISRFLPDQVFLEHDIISVRPEYPAGFCTFYRNTPAITGLYVLSPDYKAVFQSHRHFCFDECSFKFDELLYNNQHISELETEIDCMATIIDRLEKQGKIRCYRQLLVQEFLDSKDTHCWDKGRLFNCNNKEEFALIHLIQVKALSSFVVRRFRGMDLFYISPGGLGHSVIRSVEYFRLYLRRAIHNRLNTIKCRAWYWWYLGTARKIGQKDKYVDKVTFAMGPSRCTFNFLGTKTLRLDHEQNGKLRRETGSIFYIRPGLFLFVPSNRLLLIKFTFHDLKPYKLEFIDVKDGRAYRGYLLSEEKHHYA